MDLQAFACLSCCVLLEGSSQPTDQAQQPFRREGSDQLGLQPVSVDGCYGCNPEFIVCITVPLAHLAASQQGQTRRVGTLCALVLQRTHSVAKGGRWLVAEGDCPSQSDHVIYMQCSP